MATILLGIMACQNQAAKSSAPAPAPAPAPSESAATPKPFTLTLSSGGGFTGQYQGCTLTSQGEARGWRKRPGAPESVDWTKLGKPDSILALAKALDAYLAVDLEEAGNMTARIQYALPDSTHQWSIAGSGASAEAPEPFRTWYARAEAYCRSQAPQP